MSEEDVSYREDNENLLYILRQNTVQIDVEEEHVPRESITSEESIPISYFDSEINLYNALGRQIGPETFHDPEVINKTKPLDFLWTFGVNSKTGIINLTIDDRKEILFASSHFPILYNYSTKEMKCLEGHQFAINSISADNSGQWLATGDDQKEGCIIIWDSYQLFIQVVGEGLRRNPRVFRTRANNFEKWSDNEFFQRFRITKDTAQNLLNAIDMPELLIKRKPIFTIFNVYPLSGTFLLKLSGSARYLITIGCRTEGSYSVDFWLWTYGNDAPDDSIEIEKSYGAPVEICFNPNIEEYIMVIFKKQVFLFIWETEQKKLIKMKIPRINNQNKIGTLTTGTYMFNCHECYACSTKGCVLVFGNTLYAKPYEEGDLDNSKLYINAVKVSQFSVRSITEVANTIVVGDASGCLLFFDRTLRILYWFRNFNLAPIVSISFNRTNNYKREDMLAIYTVKPCESHIFGCEYNDITDQLDAIFKTALPKDASLESNQFLVNNFFVATLDSNVYAIDFLNNKCVPIFIMADDYVTAIETHHEFNYIIIGYANARIHLVDYERNELVCSTLLPNTEEYCASISCLKYSLESLHLVCGRENGEVWILESIMLTPKMRIPYKPTKHKILKIAFSLNKSQFAYYDEEKTVVLFTYNVENDSWKFTGKIRSHYDDINDIIFMPNQHKSILFTIGNDRHMVEYNNNQVGEEEFGIVCRERIEQRAVPKTFIHWSEISGNEQKDYFLIADDEHKFKLIDPETKIPKAVILAPAFGCFKNQIISKMMIIPKSDSRYMVFMTSKFIGLHIMPPDGNPYKYVGYMAHPNKVQDYLLSPDGNFLFTFGQDDHCVFKWRINTKAVELMHLLGGKELEPFYCLIEGGKNGWLFQEIKDLFYYMQILQQETIDYPRKVSDMINISELPELVRTCGFYPSEFELENMMIDIKYRNYNETAMPNTDINFIDFVKLFCNHKPAYGYSKEKIKNAFYAIIQNSDSPSDEELSREDFTSVLAYSGELISPANLIKLFKTLMRSDDTSGTLEFLPEMISFKVLYEDILGIDMGRTAIIDSDRNSLSNPVE